MIETLASSPTEEWGYSTAAISPDGHFIIGDEGLGLSKVGEVRPMTLWRASDFTKETLLIGHLDRNLSIRFSDDSRYAVSAGLDEDIIVWNIPEGSIRRRIHAGFVINQVDFYHSNSLIIAGSHETPIHIWSIETGRLLGSIKPEGSRFMDWDVNSSDGGLITVEESGRVDRWEIELQYPNLPQLTIQSDGHSYVELK